MTLQYPNRTGQAATYHSGSPSYVDVSSGTAEAGLVTVPAKCVAVFAEWAERTTALTPSDAGTNDYFGISCALSADGTTLAVGSSSWDGAAGVDQGAVYVFDWNGSSWTERTTALTPSDAGALSGDSRKVLFEFIRAWRAWYETLGTPPNQMSITRYGYQNMRGDDMVQYNVAFNISGTIDVESE